MQSLSNAQLQQCTGGGWLKILARFSGVGILLDALDNLPDIREGFYDGYNGLEPRHSAAE